MEKFYLEKEIVKNRRAFLLMDTMVAAGIIIILLGISIPYIKRYQPNLKLDAEARGLASDLRLAQQLTVSEQVVHAVRFNFADDSYEILKFDTGTTTIKSVIFDSEIRFQEINGLLDNMAVFNYYGGANQSGAITLTNVNSRNAIINIKPSGYIQME